MLTVLFRAGSTGALALMLATGATAQDTKSTAETNTTATTPTSEGQMTTKAMEAPAPTQEPTTKVKKKTKKNTKTTTPSADSNATATDAKAEPMQTSANPATATSAATAPMTASPAAAATTAAQAGTTATTATAPNPTVGGAAMEPTKTIVENASAAPNLTTLVSAVKAADLVTTLSGPGPFTVFAPSNDAFGRVAPGTVDKLMKPENKASLTNVLTYHVVPGSITLADLKAKIAAGNGTASLTTVQGGIITATLVKAASGEALTLTDANGNKSYIETADVRQSNGMVHVVNGMLVPKQQ